MALVSFKNLTTPLSNKVHLGTIAFVVLLFAAMRVAGGGVSFGPSGTSNNPIDRARAADAAAKLASSPTLEELPSSLDQISPNQQLNVLGANSNRAPARDPSEVQRPDDSESIDSVMGKKAPVRQGPNGNDSNLDEVERRLGLR